MGKYDTTIRTVLREGCRAFMGEIGLPPDLQPLDVKLPRVSAREVDFVGRDRRTGIVYHAEFQVGNDPYMAARMLIYAGQIGERVMEDDARRARIARKRPRPTPVFPDIRSTLIYIGRDQLAMPDGIKTHALQFGYDTRDIRGISPDRLLDSPVVGDAIMAVLCRDGARRDTVRRILSRLGKLEQHVLDKAYYRLLVLSELRNASGVVEAETRAMNIHVNLENIESVREHSSRKAKEALIDMLTKQLLHKFSGNFEEKEIKTRLSALNKADLEIIGVNLVEADDVEKAFDIEAKPDRKP